MKKKSDKNSRIDDVVYAAVGMGQSHAEVLRKTEDAIARILGFNKKSDRDAKLAIYRTVGPSLARLKKNGAIRLRRGPGCGPGGLWERL